MKGLDAYYTVELALVLPVILFALIFPIYEGYRLYQEVKVASVLGWEEDFDARRYIKSSWEDAE